MTLNQLLSFITVAQYSSFTEAAKHLHLVQSAVSHNINTLEKELGLKLFIRQKQYTCLTPAGQALLEDATKILNQTAVAEQKMSVLARGLVGSLVFGTAFTHSMLPLKDKIVSFIADHPYIEVRMRSFHIDNIRRDIYDNIVDFAFIHHIDIKDDPAIEWRALFKENYILAIPGDHKLNQLKKVNLNQLTNEKWIFIARQYSPSHFDNMIRLCSNANFSPTIVGETSSISMILMMVSMGMGISIIPESWANYYKEPGLCYLDIDDAQANREQGLAWNKTNQNTSIKIFLDYLFTTPV